jgi:hypothetical protein
MRHEAWPWSTHFLQIFFTAFGPVRRVVSKNDDVSVVSRFFRGKEKQKEARQGARTESTVASFGVQRIA